MLRELPEAELCQHQECQVLRLLSGEDGSPYSIELKFYAGGSARTATVPLDAVEPVLSQSTEQRTAVLWGLEKSPQEFLEASLHALMDQGLVMAAGLNVVRLNYDRQERWWK